MACEVRSQSVPQLCAAERGELGDLVKIKGTRRKKNWELSSMIHTTFIHVRAHSVDVQLTTKGRRPMFGTWPKRLSMLPSARCLQFDMARAQQSCKVQYLSSNECYLHRCPDTTAAPPHGLEGVSSRISLLKAAPTLKISLCGWHLYIGLGSTRHRHGSGLLSQ